MGRRIEMEIKVGDKVRTVYGRIETVLMVEEPCRVWTREYTRGWYHPTKVVRVFRSKELGWVTIPGK
jgi:hypothetical protein